MVQITYKSGKVPTLPGLMAVDVERGQLILAPEDPPGCCSSSSKGDANPHMYALALYCTARHLPVFYSVADARNEL